jgi:putative ABC transport system ATP-binding protein
MLSVKNLSKTYASSHGPVTAVEDISFNVGVGEFVSIIGKSGSGKSTLLSLLGALDSPTEGEILVDTVDIARLSGAKQTKYRAKKIGFVFQHYNLIPNLTAQENVMLALEFGGTSSTAEKKERAEALLGAVGISNDEQLRKPAKLSGGQQQRVSIARALANKPAIILADEPTGNLDTETGKLIFDLLHSLSRSEGTTILVVTHDLEIAGKTDRQFNLKDGKLTEKKK